MNKKILLLSFIMATLFFIIGILLGTYTTTLKEQTFDRETQELFLQTMSAEMQFEIGADDPCSFLGNTNLNSELSALEKKMVYLQEISGEESFEFNFLRKQYFLLEIRHWLLHKKANSLCEEKKNLILYFYTDNCASCDNYGLVLSAFRKKYNDIRVYSFDLETDDPAVRALISKFNVSESPAIVFNDELFTQSPSVKNLELLRR